jgi:hypothetical protein
LCGLSGIAHGLTAIWALEMIYSEHDRTFNTVGICTLALLVCKSIFEAASGNVIFQSFHMGNVGLPVAVAHAGGVLGGVLAFAETRRFALCKAN